MKKYLLDTSFIFAIINTEDPNNRIANNIWQEILEQILCVSIISVAELSCAGENINYIDFIRESNIEILDVDIENIEFLTQNIEPSKRRSLKANDCLILSTTILNNLELITFDKNLEKAYKKLI